MNAESTAGPVPSTAAWLSPRSWRHWRGKTDASSLSAITEVVIIAILALVLLGPDRLPDAARTLRSGLRDFRRATEGLKDTLERETEGLREELDSLSEQLSLVLAMLLGFGIIFEVPVVMTFLSMIGLVSWGFLARYRRNAILVNVVPAILTPTGDPFNLALMAVPMIVFYEISIVLARELGKRPKTAITTA